MNGTKFGIAALGLLAGAALGLALAGAASAQDQPQAGMVTAVKGPVTVLGPNGLRNARMMGVFYLGETVQVGEGGQAVLLHFSGGRREQIGAGTSVTIRFGGSTAIAGDAVRELSPLDAETTESLRATASKTWGDKGGGVGYRGLGDLEVPKARFATDRPTLRWRGDSNGRPFEVLVRAVDGTDLWKTTTTTTEVTYPQDAPQLQPGEVYSLAVAIPGSLGAEKDDAMFSIAEPAERERAEALYKAAEAKLAESPDDPAPLLALAAELHTRGLNIDAARVLEQLLAKHPNEPYVQRLLAEIYDAMELQNAAAELRLAAAKSEGLAP